MIRLTMENARATLSEEKLREITFVADPYATADGAHAILLATEWPQYRQLDLSFIAQKMSKPVFVEGRNVFSPKDVEARGLKYVGIGR